jgi:hypothetical protein
LLLSDGVVSHVCAVNLFDGSTSLHRAVESGDNVPLVKVLLAADKTCINIQNDAGLSPLHLACKLGRKKVLEHLLVSIPHRCHPRYCCQMSSLSLLSWPSSVFSSFIIILIASVIFIIISCCYNHHCHKYHHYHHHLSL